MHVYMRITAIISPQWWFRASTVCPVIGSNATRRRANKATHGEVVISRKHSHIHHGMLLWKLRRYELKDAFRIRSAVA